MTKRIEEAVTALRRRQQLMDLDNGRLWVKNHKEAYLLYAKAWAGEKVFDPYSQLPIVPNENFMKKIEDEIKPPNIEEFRKNPDVELVEKAAQQVVFLENAQFFRNELL